MQSIGLDIRVLSGDSKEITIHDDDDDDEHAVRKKANDLGLEVDDFPINQPITVEPPNTTINVNLNFNE